MGLTVLLYILLGFLGGWMSYIRWRYPSLRVSYGLLRQTHLILGLSMVGLILVLLAIGIVGTLGHFGSLGQSSHLIAGIAVVILALVSAVSAFQIRRGNAWTRRLHLGINICLLIALGWVSVSGWDVVQKYLP